MTAKKAAAPKISKQTRDAIAFFQGRKSGVELLEESPISAYRYQPRTFNDAFWDFVQDNSAQFGLGIITVAFAMAIYQLIKIGGTL